jgi:di/tricarboxylate transporter
MIYTIVVLVLTAVAFVVGKVRSDVVALVSLLCLILGGVITPQEALSAFSSPVVIMMVGLFVVGGAIFQTGLARMISSKILRMAGGNELRIFILMMLVTSGIGAFVSNSGTVALLLPIVVSLSTAAGISPSRMLMPMAFASSMGGMMTLIGTPPNMIIQETLTGAGYETLTFFSFLPTGLICVAVGILVLIPLSKMFLQKSEANKSQKKGGKSFSQLVSEYGLTDNLFRFRVTSNSKLQGKTIGYIGLRQSYNINILEVRRGDVKHHRFFKTITQHVASPQLVLEIGDVLYVQGNAEDIKRFVDEFKVELLKSRETEVAGKSGEPFDFFDIGIAEIMMLPTSGIIGKTIHEAGFRSKFDVNVLGIRRHGDILLSELGEQTIETNDVLLVQGSWTNIDRLQREDDNWVVMGQPLEQAAKVTIDYKAPIAALIMIAMVVIMVCDFIPIAPVTAVIMAAVAMVLTGCFRSVEAAYKTINWESIVLIGAMMPMSVALEKTGASELISTSLVGALGQFGPIAVMAGIYFTTSLMTMFISNTATAVLLAPIALSAAQQLGINPTSMLFAVSIAASMCFASPFSTPPNALVMTAGKYEFMDYVKVGLPLQVIMGIVMILVLPFIFPF